MTTQGSDPSSPADPSATPSDAIPDDQPLIDLPQPGKPKIRAPQPRGQKVNPNLEGKTSIRGSHVGDRYVKVIRAPRLGEFQRVSPGYLVAGEEASSGRGPVQQSFNKMKRFLIGQPLTTAAGAHERLSNKKALAVLSSDALSSVA